MSDRTGPVWLIDASITSLSGSSEQLLAQAPQLFRRWMMIQNTGNANIGVNLTGGTAAIGGTGTLTLVPNGSMIFSNEFCPAQKVMIIGTAGQPVACLVDPA